MFNTDLVRKGLAIQIVKAREAQRVGATEAEEAVMIVHDSFAGRRLLLAETYQYLADLLNQNVQLNNDALSGRNVDRLPKNLQKQWRAVWGDRYIGGGGGFALYTSKEEETRSVHRAKADATSENWDAIIPTLENAALILAAFEGPNITYSTWERLGLKTQVLSDAVATAQLANEESGK